ncbi:MAG: flagellar biosynthesis protein FlhF [Synergistaceae bacterium]|jgi:flagellar biosynthesis protein FlhF|nr:flagellar biosynthesis protein FlhF [Synergistaceae bacterium]
MRVFNQITFEAKDDAEALRLASERLGKDAVILSTRPVRVGGFMGFFQRQTLLVQAGILQEDRPKEEKPKEKDDAVARENLRAFQKLLELKEKQVSDTKPDVKPLEERTPYPENPAKVIYSPAGVGNKNSQDYDKIVLSSAGLASTITEAVRPQPVDDSDPQKLKAEMDVLSKQLETIMRRLGEVSGGFRAETETFEKREGRFEKKFEMGLPGITALEGSGGGADELYRKLVEEEVEPDYARELVKEYRENGKSVSFTQWIESKIRCATDITTDALGGRKVMLVGPTGVGKTTTIAKLAAIEALWNRRNVLLLTSDTYRVAAVDQLRTYAKIMGVPIEVIHEVEKFASVLSEHEDAELILLDTAGRGQKESKNVEGLQAVHDAYKPDAVHLVLAANMKYRDMVDVVERLSVLPISHMVFSKLDETVSYGALFNVLQYTRSMDRPISYFTVGQNVPNDIEVASAARFARLLMMGGVGDVRRE